MKPLKNLEIINLIGSIFIGLGLIAILAFFILPTGDSVLITFLGVAMVIVFLANLQGIIRTRTLFKNMKTHNPTNESRPITDTNVIYDTKNVPSAQVGDNEKIVAFIEKPVIQSGSRSVATGFAQQNERFTNPINTLLFTDKQIIGLMLTADTIRDMPSFIVSGTSSIWANNNFAWLYHKKYPEIIRTILQKPLDSVVNTHVNIGIPYNMIQSVSVTTNLLRARILKIKLISGDEVKFGVLFMNPDELRSAIQPLKAYTQVES